MKLITLLLALSLIAAQAVEEPYRNLSATTFTQGAKKYAYLQWTSPDPLTFRETSFAIFAKPGAPNAAAPYVVAGTLQLQTNPVILDAILGDLPGVVFEPNGANVLIDEMFGAIMPAGPLTLGAKLSVVLRDAQANPESLRTLALLARTQPFIGACLGTSAVVELPANLATFEFRSRTAPGAAFDVVAGRVTVDHNAPPTIPAPPRPEQIFEDKPSDHLNAKLRWDSTAALARATPLTYGFNVYRLTKGFAVGGGYHTTPPTATQIAAAIAVFPNSAKQVNAYPVLPQDGPDMPFLVDDNGVNFGEGAPLNDGDQFYYYVAARDILGRPGALSPGLLVVICDRMPPGQPTDVHATDLRSHNAATNTSRTRLQVKWQPSTTGDAPTGGYYVYRWASQAALLANAAAETPTAMPVSPLIPHVNGLTDYSWIDDSPGAPTPETAARQTAWYSVRAVDMTACGPLESGDSAPGWGVPRDFEGPLAAGSSITFSDTCAEFAWQPPGVRELNGDPGFTGPHGDVSHIELKAERLDPAIKKIEWALSYDDNGERVTVPLGEGDYTPNVNALIFKRRIPRKFGLEIYHADFLLRATDCTGKQVTRRFPADAIIDESNAVHELCVRIDMVTTETTIETGGVSTGPVTIYPNDPLTGGLNPPTIEFLIPPTAVEYKLYKRIDGGPLLLVEQNAGVAPNSIEEIEDAALPANASELCYYVQYYNADGSPSALAKIGCLNTGPRAPLPVPILAEVEAAGTVENPQAILSWFCPREGVASFRLYVGDGLTRIVTDYSDQLTAVEESYARPLPSAPTSAFGRPETAPYAGELLDGVAYYPYQTERIGPKFGNPVAPDEFSITLDLAPGREYHFYVRASNRATGVASNTVDFTWSPPPPGPLAQVPWPARTLPPVDEAFLPEVSAVYFDDDRGAAVRIGDLDYDILGDVTIGAVTRTAGQGLSQTPSSYPDNADNRIDLYSTARGETVFPCVAYRVQVPNLLYPVVSGDVVQVSPLVEGIRTLNTGTGGTSRVQIWDPFTNLAAPTDLDLGVFIFDTQPVIEGAVYKYWLVRFKENREIDRVLPAGQLTIPLITP